MHTRNAGQLGLEVRNRPQIRIVLVEITKCPAQKREEQRLVVIALGTNLNQLDKISSRLGPKVTLTNSGEWIRQYDLGESVQGRFSTRHQRNFCFEKKIQLAGERRFSATRAFGHRLNATQRFGTPGNDQAGVTEFAFAKKNRRRGLHGENLARDPRR